jgi:hypothetical protein
VLIVVENLPTRRNSAVMHAGIIELEGALGQLSKVELEACLGWR